MWTGAADAGDLKRRIAAIPGFGEMKVASLLAVLAKQLGVRPIRDGRGAPTHPPSAASTPRGAGGIPGSEAGGESGARAAR